MDPQTAVSAGGFQEPIGFLSQRITVIITAVWSHHQPRPFKVGVAGVGDLNYLSINPFDHSQNLLSPPENQAVKRLYEPCYEESAQRQNFYAVLGQF